jgi:dihydrolipoamide dehydrogenase
LLALAIDRALTVSDLLRMPVYHPVFEEGLRTALRHLSAQLPGSKDSDLPRCATAPRSRSPMFAGRAIAVQK